MELHPEKSAIIPLRKGITFLGYRMFYHYKLLKRRNIRSFKRKFNCYLEGYKNKEMTKKELLEKIQGWFGYAQWANTYNFRQEIIKRIEEIDSLSK